MNEDIITISDTDSSEQSMVLVQPKIQVNEVVDNSPTVQSTETNVISLSSQSVQPRCPVSWGNSLQKHKFKYINSESFFTPSPKAKVSNWLFANSQASKNMRNDFNNFSLSNSTFVDNKSSILIRQDYRKSDTGTGDTRNSSLNENLSSTEIHVNKSGCSDNNYRVQTDDDFSCKIIIEPVKQTELPIEVVNLSQETVHNVETNSSNLCDSPIQIINEQVVETKSEIFPINIEVPNKVELCEYLKLMNMNPIHKSDGLKQNRRSSRVKNLAILSERRALERELNSANSDQEKKKRNSVDLEANSCVGSDSSKESSVLSQKTEGSFQKSSSKKTLVKQSDQENVSSCCFVPIISLQVPEVSTTSLLRRQSCGEQTIHNGGSYSNKNNKDCTVKTQRNISVNQKVKNKVDKSPNTCSSESRSVIMTKKSFSQLNIDLSNLKQTPNAHIENYHYCLMKYLCTRPQMDFEDFYTVYMKAIDSPKKNVTTSNLKTPKKTHVNSNTLKRQLRKKLILKTNYVKSKLRQTKERLTMKNMHTLKKKQHPQGSMKDQRRLKFYLRKRDLTKLRSRGKLKEIGIQSILLNHERRKKMKKKFKVKSTQVTPKYEEKDYKAAELIQTGPQSSFEVLPQINGISEEQKKTEPALFQTEFSPLKLLRLKSDIDMLKNLTPEHRKALFESKKFLLARTKENTILKSNSNMSIFRSVEESVNTDSIEKADKTTETVQQCDIIETPTPVHVAFQTETEMELSRSCSEDAEVDKLMSNKTCKLPKDNLSNTDIKDHWQCESESTKSQTTTHSSLDIISSHLDSTTNSVPNDEIPNLLSPTEIYDPSEQIIEEIVESNPLQESDMKMDDDGSDDTENEPEVISISKIKRMNIEYIHVPDDNEAEIKSLHHCLTQPRKKHKERNEDYDQDWEHELSTKSDKKVNQSYAIDLSRSNGAIMNAYYLDFNLVVVQELLISFWYQTSLGNVLGAQDMWMPKGDTKRLVLGNGCTCQDSSETIMVLDTCIAYFELWTKEHKSDKRERPVADIFVTVYFRLTGVGPDKKVLQLENIHGYANDVQYIVIKNSPMIVVSWNTVNDQLTSTVVHKYRLSPDYQAVTNITSMQAAAHYVSSLHNIEDSDTLIMGCGEDKITLWHIDHGYIVATMDLMAISQQPRTLWAKADRGFIFTLHNFNDGHLHLIATNSFDYSWKQLQVYKQESEYENLLGICIENGLVVAFYDTGILCWKAKSGELILDTPSESSIFLPFGKHIIVMVENQVHVRHVLEYLVTIEEDS